MALTREELIENLSILNIESGDTLESITLRDTIVAFQKLAISLHPDKAGPESKAAFQRLSNAYEKVREHFKQKDVSKDETNIVDDEVERFFNDNFEAFNFPFENKGSFTVRIEDYLADTWQECLNLLLGEPKHIMNGHGTLLDQFWKVEYGQVRYR